MAIAVTVVVCLQYVATAIFLAGLIFPADVPTTSPADADAGSGGNDLLVDLGSVLYFLFLVAGFVLSARWIYVAACNVRALGARHLDSSPGWSVGWYAVPIMNWFRPFQAMSEIYRASHRPTEWRSQPTPPILGSWWAAWILSGLFGNVERFIPLESFGPLGVGSLSAGVFANVALNTAASALFLSVIWRIFQAQQASHRSASHLADTFA